MFAAWTMMQGGLWVFGAKDPQSGCRKALTALGDHNPRIAGPSCWKIVRICIGRLWGGESTCCPASLRVPPPQLPPLLLLLLLLHLTTTQGYQGHHVEG